jgi:hypothetical protein
MSADGLIVINTQQGIAFARLCALKGALSGRLTAESEHILKQVGR